MTNGYFRKLHGPSGECWEWYEPAPTKRKPQATRTRLRSWFHRLAIRLAYS